MTPQERARRRARENGRDMAAYDRQVAQEAESRTQAAEWFANLRENPEFSSMYDVSGDTPVQVRRTEYGALIIVRLDGVHVWPAAFRPGYTPPSRWKEPKRRLRAAWNMLRYGYDPEDDA